MQDAEYMEQKKNDRMARGNKGWTSQARQQELDESDCLQVTAFNLHVKLGHIAVFTGRCLEVPVGCLTLVQTVPLGAGLPFGAEHCMHSPICS